MTSHQAPREPRRFTGVLAVVLTVIVGVVAVAVALTATGHPDQAVDLTTVALVFGVGLAVGFRKQWTR